MTIQRFEHYTDDELVRHLGNNADDLMAEGELAKRVVADTFHPAPWNEQANRIEELETELEELTSKHKALLESLKDVVEEAIAA